VSGLREALRGFSGAVLTLRTPLRLSINGMRLSAACLAIFGLTGSAIAYDVQRGDAVVTLADGIGCYDRVRTKMSEGMMYARSKKASFPKGAWSFTRPLS
jgi:hypothetical protein